MDILEVMPLIKKAALDKKTKEQSRNLAKPHKKEPHMNKLLAKITTWAMDDDGATAIEYGLIAAGVSIAIAVIVFTLGDEVSGTFGDVTTALQGRG